MVAPIYRFTVPVFGYISPAIVMFTIITNTLVCVVLMKKNMRSPTNLLLFAMALSDMFTGVSPVPCFIYFYTFGRYVSCDKEQLTFSVFK